MTKSRHIRRARDPWKASWPLRQKFLFVIYLNIPSVRVFAYRESSTNVNRFDNYLRSEWPGRRSGQSIASSTSSLAGVVAVAVA